VADQQTKSGAMQWLEERVGWESIREFASHKTVPIHSATIWYYFGGITLFLFVIQVLTGILLLLYYRPTPTEAYESVQFIMTQVEFGWLIRSVHGWSANLMILAAFLIILVGRKKIDRFINYWTLQSENFLRAWLLFGAAFGAFVVYSVAGV